MFLFQFHICIQKYDLQKLKFSYKKSILLNSISTIWSLFCSLLFAVSLFQIINYGAGSNRAARDNKEILQYKGMLIIERSQLLNNFYCDVPITTLKSEADLNLIFLWVAFFLREKEYGGHRLFCSSVNCHSQFFVFVGTICCFFEQMRGGLAYRMN